MIDPYTASVIKKHTDAIRNVIRSSTRATDEDYLQFSDELNSIEEKAERMKTLKEG